MTPPRPMLASPMREMLTHDAFDAQYGTGWSLEEKLDGHRCLVEVGGGDGAVLERHPNSLYLGDPYAITAWSRPQPGKGGVALTRALPEEMVMVLRCLPPGLYDGELVAATGKAWDVTRKTSHTVFVMFDVLTILGNDLTTDPYHERRARMLDCLRYLPDDQDRVSTVVSLKPTWKDVLAIWARGGEGAILKQQTSPYVPGWRSPHWLKVKQVHSAITTIVGFEAGKSGPYSALKVRDEQGRETTVKTPDHATLRAITANPDGFVGRRVVIEFQERTPSGAPRHGRFDHFAEPADVIAFPAGSKDRR